VVPQSSSSSSSWSGDGEEIDDDDEDEDECGEDAVIFDRSRGRGRRRPRSGDAEEIEDEDEDEDDYGEDAVIFDRSRGRRRPWSGAKRSTTRTYGCDVTLNRHPRLADQAEGAFGRHRSIRICVAPEK
jgi:hypothetical protein